MEELDKRYEVIDNFLQPNVFEKLEKTIMGTYFPWFHYDTIILPGEYKKNETEIQVLSKELRDYEN